jgi:hypothetical protein
MIVIDQDPALVIPNICERYIKHKAILVYMCSKQNSNKYIAIVNKHQFLYLRGGSNCLDAIGEWVPIGSTLISLLCKIWNTYSLDFNIKIFVISDIQELTEVSQRYDITNRHVLEAANRIIQSNRQSL